MLTQRLKDYFEEIEFQRSYTSYPMANLPSFNNNYNINIKFADTPGSLVLEYQSTGIFKQKVYDRNPTQEYIAVFNINKTPEDYINQIDFNIDDIDIELKEGITKDELNDIIHLMTCYISRPHYRNNSRLRRVNIAQ